MNDVCLQTNFQPVNNQRLVLVKICHLLMFFQDHSFVRSKTYVYQPVYNMFTTTYKVVENSLQIGWNNVVS